MRPDLGRWLRRRRARADALAEAGQLVGEIRDRLGRLHALVIVTSQWTALRGSLAELTAAAYLDGAADAALEDEHGILLGCDRAGRAAQHGVAAGATADALLLDMQQGMAAITTTNGTTFSTLAALLDRHGIEVDRGLAQLGAPGLSALFTSHQPQPHRQEIL